MDRGQGDEEQVTKRMRIWPVRKEVNQGCGFQESQRTWCIEKSHTVDWSNKMKPEIGPWGCQLPQHDPLQQDVGVKA
jgi:hypothetical protein